MSRDIGRPAPDESPEYYRSYISLVPDGDIRVTLNTQHGEMLAFLETIPESRASYRYAPEKWTIAEVLSHIIDCERLYVFRAFWFARGLETALPSFEPEVAVKNSGAGTRPLSALVREWAVIRASTAEFFRNLPADGWMCRGTASGMSFSVRALAFIAAGHVAHHQKILRKHYLAGG